MLVATAWKGLLLAAGSFPFNADEAVVAIMARHFLQGLWQVFFYGQAYMGSLDAALAAFGFALFGQHVWVIRAVQMLLYAGTVATTLLLTAQLTRSAWATAAAGLLMAFPTVMVTLYTTVSLGGYGEALLLGNLLVLLALATARRPDRWVGYLAWGFTAGLAFWAFGLTLVYSLPSGAAIVAANWRARPVRGTTAHVALLGLGLLVGAAPWWGWAAVNGLSPLLRELAGSAIAGASPAVWPQSVAAHTLNLLLFGMPVVFGIRPPWSTAWLSLPLAPLALAFGLASLAHGVAAARGGESGRLGRWVLLGVVGATLAGFVLTPFGADPSGRYFLPLVTPLAVFGASLLDVLRRRAGFVWAAAWLAAVLGFNLIGTLQSVKRNPPGLTTQFDSVTQIDHRFDAQLISFLDAHGERRGYSNYWVAYPLAFQSGERMIFVPKLPYHPDFRYTPRDDRYPPYDEMVAASSRVAYITTRHPALDQRLRDGLRAAGVQFQEAWVGDYHLFFDLSAPVRPDQILAAGAG